MTNRTPILFPNVLIIAACGLVYELLAGAVASYALSPRAGRGLQGARASVAIRGRVQA